MSKEKEFIAEIGKTMRDILDEGGITHEYLRDKLKEELDATETKSFSFKGDVFESEPKVAWDIRQRGRQDAHKLRGDYPAEKHELSGDISVNTGIKRPGDESKTDEG